MKYHDMYKCLILCCLLLNFGSNAHEQNYNDFRNLPTNCGELKNFMGATLWHIGKHWRYAMERALKPLKDNLSTICSSYNTGLCNQRC